MKTINFTVNGDATAAIDKTIKLRAASPHVSNVVEVHITRARSVRTVTFIIPPHIGINIAYTLNGEHKTVANIYHNSLDSEKTIMVDRDSEIQIRFSVDDGWELEDAMEKTYTINEDTVITIPEPTEKAFEQCIVTFITNPNVGAMVYYTNPDGSPCGQGHSIANDSSNKTIIVQKDSEIRVDYSTNPGSDLFIPISKRQLIQTINEDTTIVFPEASFPVPQVGLSWNDNPSNCEYCTVSANGTYLDACVHLEELHYNDMGIESYNQFFFQIWDNAYGMNVYPESCNPIIEPAEAAECFVCQNDGAGAGAGSLVLMKDIRDIVVSNGSYTISGMLSFKTSESVDAIKFEFNITFIL